MHGRGYSEARLINASFPDGRAPISRLYDEVFFG
jgi:hypothetical protein